MASAGSETEIVSKQMSTGQKRFYFNLKQNDRGRFLKVCACAWISVADQVADRQGGALIQPAHWWQASFRLLLNCVYRLPRLAAKDAIRLSSLTGTSTALVIFIFRKCVACD